MLRISQPRIISFVQFLGKRGIFSVRHWNTCTQNEWGRPIASGDKSQLKIALGLVQVTLSPKPNAPAIRSPKPGASFLGLAENLTINPSAVLLLGPSVDALSGSDCSLIELCEGFSEIAGLVRR